MTSKPKKSIPIIPRYTTTALNRIHMNRNTKLAKPNANSTVLPNENENENMSNLSDVSTIGSSVSSLSLSSSNQLRPQSHHVSHSHLESDDTTLEQLSSEQSSTTSLGALSYSRSSSLSSRTNSLASLSTTSCANKNNTGKSAFNNASMTNSEPSDVVKQIEDLVARNKLLQEENAILRNLINEENIGTKSASNIDERRIMMLKCQIYQLEKQINILSKSLAFRKNAHADSQNTLNFISDALRSTVQQAQAKTFNGPPSNYTIERHELLKWLDLVESTRIKLNKTQLDEIDDGMNASSESNIGETSLFESRFSNASQLTILDVCSGNLNHVNLKEVSSLESDLSQLFKKLTRLHESLKTTHTSNMVPFQKENVKTQLGDTIEQVKTACLRLFDLSLLVPSNPVNKNKMNKSYIKGLSQEMLMTRLKSFGLPKAKHSMCETLVKAQFVAANYHVHMKTLECEALNEELKFYRASYGVQKSYVESVMHLFRRRYEQFVDELRQQLVEPLNALIDSFWKMKESSTELNLKEFLGLFKQHAEPFRTILASMPVNDQDDIIALTFQQLNVKLEAEIANLNRECLNNLDKMNLNSIELNQLSTQSDQLLMDIASNANN